MARVKNTMITCVDLNETKQKSNGFADVCYRLGAGKLVPESSLLFKSINEREQEDSRGKYSDASLFLRL